MDKRGATFSPGRASPERKDRISRALSLSPESDIGRLRPELLGEGKTRVVFELQRDSHEVSDRVIEKKKRRGALVKVDKGAVEVALRDILKTGSFDISKETREAFSRRLAYERIARKSFHDFFADISLPEKPFLRKIPLSRAAIKEFFPDIVLPDSFPESVEVPALVYVQNRAPDAAFGPSSHEFLFRCSERPGLSAQSPSDSALFHANRTFVDLHASWHDIRQLAGTSPEIRTVMRLAENDQQLRALLQDFFDRSLKYTERTGEILDLFGSDNVRLYQDTSGAWCILLLDAYARGRVFAQAQEAVRAALMGYEITDNEALALVSSLNYVRNMNAIAFAVNASGRFRLSHADIAPAVQKLIPIMRKVLTTV